MTDAEKLAVAIMRQLPEDPDVKSHTATLTDEDVLAVELCQKIAAILRR